MAFAETKNYQSTVNKAINYHILIHRIENQLIQDFDERTEKFDTENKDISHRGPGAP
jgi:hypothetical protein